MSRQLPVTYSRQKVEHGNSASTALPQSHQAAQNLETNPSPSPSSPSSPSSQGPEAPLPEAMLLVAVHPGGAVPSLQQQPRAVAPVIRARSARSARSALALRVEKTHGELTQGLLKHQLDGPKKHVGFRFEFAQSWMVSKKSAAALMSLFSQRNGQTRALRCPFGFPYQQKGVPPSKNGSQYSIEKDQELS